MGFDGVGGPRLREILQGTLDYSFMPNLPQTLLDCQLIYLTDMCAPLAPGKGATRD